MRSCPQFPQSLIQVCPSAALSPLPVSHILCIQSGGPFQCLASRVGRLHQHPSRNRVSFLNPFSAPAVLISSPKSLLYGLLRTPPPQFQVRVSSLMPPAPPSVRTLHCFSHSWLTCQPYSDFCLDSGKPVPDAHPSSPPRLGKRSVPLRTSRFQFRRPPAQLCTFPSE